MPKRKKSPSAIIRRNTVCKSIDKCFYEKDIRPGNKYDRHKKDVKVQNLNSKLMYTSLYECTSIESI